MAVIPGLEVTAAPAGEPVDFANDLASHLSMTEYDTAHEAFVMSLAKSARHKVEHDTQKALITRTYKQYFNAFPCGRDPLLLLRSPAQAADFALAYKDENGDAQTLVLGTDIVLDTSRTPNQIHLKKDKEWPTALDEINSITVTYKCGYGATRADVPAEFRQLIAMLVAGWFENREAVSSIPLYELPNPVGYDALLGTVQTWWF